MSKSKRYNKMISDILMVPIFGLAIVNIFKDSLLIFQVQSVFMIIGFIHLLYCMFKFGGTLE